MVFNLNTGKVDGQGKLHRADEYIHIDISCGMLSFLMPEKEIIQFIEFLSCVKNSKDGYFISSEKFDYQSERHDEGFVNMLIGRDVIAVIIIKVEYIDALISYLYENRFCDD